MSGRVYVLGNAGLDLRIELPRMPRPGETLLGTNPSRAPGGKGLNQAVVAARVGAAVHLLAPLGSDSQGDEIAAALADEPLTATLLRLPHPTDYSILMVLPSGENSITGAGPCAAALTPAQLRDFIAPAAPGDVLLLQGNLTEAATRAAFRTQALTIFNPSPLWWDARPVLPECDLVIANQDEAYMLTGLPPGEPACVALAGSGTAILTLGREGCLVADPDGIRHHSAHEVDTVDSTGCGDTFCGVLAALLSLGHRLDPSIDCAQRAASLTASRVGAYPSLPSTAELAALA